MRTIADLRSQMTTRGIKYMYVKDSVCNLFAANVPNAGPCPNIAGMRSKFWGKNALIVKQGQFAYNIS